MEEEAFDSLIRGVGRKELNENNDTPALDNTCAEEVIESCGRGSSVRVRVRVTMVSLLHKPHQTSCLCYHY